MQAAMTWLWVAALVALAAIESRWRRVSDSRHRDAPGQCDRTVLARKAKDINGMYLWRSGIGGVPDTFIGRPLDLSPFERDGVRFEAYFDWEDHKLKFVSTEVLM